jgi:hypothetical protein
MAKKLALLTISSYRKDTSVCACARAGRRFVNTAVYSRIYSRRTVPSEKNLTERAAFSVKNRT